MARMHSGKRGKAKSYKPAESSAAEWTSYKPKEIERIVIKLAKSGENPSKIGTHLRDQYGIPDVRPFLGKRITDIVKENNLLPEIPEDLMAILRKEVLLGKHLEHNAKDETAKRGLILARSKAGRLVKYYKKVGRLPADWKADPERIALMVE